MDIGQSHIYVVNQLKVSKNLFFIVNTIKIFIKTKADSTCITPNGKSGQCLPLTNCEKLFNNTLSQSEAEFTFTYDSFCGWYTKPLVCCGEDDDYLENFIHNLPEETDCGLWNDVNNIPPWLVLITGEYECLGTIINKNYILTKASCIVSISNL